MKKKYGMAPQDFRDLLEAQQGRCMICNQEMEIPGPDNRIRTGLSAVVDHNHAKDEVRAILCNNCNRGLGFFGNNIRHIQSALSYLKIFGEG